MGSVPEYAREPVPSPSPFQEKDKSKQHVQKQPAGMQSIPDKILDEWTQKPARASTVQHPQRFQRKATDLGSAPTRPVTSKTGAAGPAVLLGKMVQPPKMQFSQEALQNAQETKWNTVTVTK